jgi:putative addiction module antidote
LSFFISRALNCIGLKIIEWHRNNNAQDAIMLKVKVTAVGNSMGIELPQEVLSKFNVAKADALYLVKNAEGFVLTLYQQDFESQMAAAEKVLKSTVILFKSWLNDSAAMGIE